MKDDTCVHFLQWCLPRLNMRWEGFRKVRGQVCKRITRRLQELNLTGLDDYREYLAQEPEEWEHLAALCRVTISRFYRDHGVFDRLVSDVMPSLGDRWRCWSAGCASGEEPYTLAICIRSEHAGQPVRNRKDDGDHVEILGTDIDPNVLERARVGCYPQGTLKELPAPLIDLAFEVRDHDEDPYCLRPAFRKGVTFRRHDVKDEPPDGPFDVILCRNLVFTYFDNSLQRHCLERFHSVLRPGGAFVIGKHEELPEGDGFLDWFADEGIFRRGS